MTGGGGEGFRVVIPARYASTRLPGKPLRLLAGRPMVAHVWDRALESGADEVVIACDDERIREVALGFGADVAMTSPAHASGTDRLAEVAAARGWPDRAIVVNLQGDEPCMPGAAVASVARALARVAAAGIATLATPIREASELFDPAVVKVVLDEGGMARWFSRAPLPWVRDAFSTVVAGGALPAALPSGVPFLRHLGLYAYRAEVLRRLTATPPHPHELAESLEQLRALAIGVPIFVEILDKAPGHGVDTEADLARVDRVLSTVA